LRLRDERVALEEEREAAGAEGQQGREQRRQCQAHCDARESGQPVYRLATGVGRWELALILAFFVLLLLWGLEYRETEQVTRAMELTVKTRNVDVTQDILLRLFRKYDFDAEVRTIDRPDADDEMGCIVYYVNISPFVSTDRLSDEILTADHKNVDSVEWDQQKNTSYFYQ
jgi:hypothetical protein